MLGSGTVISPGGWQELAMNRLSLLVEFAVFLKENKKLWLLPIVVVLVLLGALLVYVQGSALAPFIYTTF